jgi:chemotaxis protein methyltransferase CheR
MSLSPGQFQKFSELVYRESGIKLSADKITLLNARIGKRLRTLAISPRDYFELIQKDVSEMQLFLDAISTNYTFFFRESKSFRYLQDGCREIWCAAASSGEEPYSLAIHCLELGLTPSILATDISTTCLQRGKQGVYPKQIVKNIPQEWLRRYFQKGRGKWSDYVRVKAQLSKLIRFEKFNLLKDFPPSRSFDVIFCRNVMIYFDKPTKETVIAKLSRTLKDGGYFIIGGSESLSGLRHNLKYLEPSVYQRN